MAEATASGILEKTEQDIVRRLFLLSDLTVETLMTPRERIVWLDLESPAAQRRSEMIGVAHSRFVACEGELDRVVGYAKVQDLLDQCIRGEDPDPRTVLRQPHVVPPWTPAFRVLERFQSSGDHIALIQGPAGRVSGLVTLNDVLQSIVGEFPEPHEKTLPAVRRPDGSWLMDGHHLGDEPSAADEFRWRGLRIEVVDMDGSRVDKVLVQMIQAGDPS